MPAPVRACLFAAALLLACAPSAQAEEPPTGPSVARHVAEGRYEAARAALHRLVAGRHDAALHIAQLEGVIRLREGRYREAIGIFRSILSAKPDFEPARVELARSLFLAGDAEASEHHFEALARGSGDDSVRRFAERHLDRIETERSHGFSLYMSALPSTNVNKATDNHTYKAGGVDFAIDEDSRRESGVGAGAGGSAFKTFRLGSQTALIASGSVDVKKYQDTTEYDEVGVGGSLALSRRFGRLTLAAGPTAEYRWAAWDPYLLRYGVTGGGRMAVGRRNVVSLSFSALRQDYVDLDHRDGHRISGSLAVRRLLSTSQSLTVRMGLTSERTERRHLDYDGFVLGAQFDKEWGGGLMTSLFASYEKRRYLGDFPGAGAPREDEEYAIGTGLSHRRLSFGGFTPKLTYRFTRRYSTVSFYDYSSHDGGLTLTRKF